MLSATKKTKGEDLRQKAEEVLKNRVLGSGKQISETDAMKLLHEIEVYEIELEMQNEALLLAKLHSEEIARKYTDLFDFAPSGYFILSRTGEIIDLNLYGANMLGKDRLFLKARRFALHVSRESLPVFNHFLERIFLCQGKESCEVIIPSNNDAPLHVHITGSLSTSENNCLINCIDITERVEMEKNLEIARAKAEESDRLKSSFLANMSHEIRTPMNSILGFSNLLRRPTISEEDKEKYFQLINSSGNRLLTIISDIVDVSKIEVGQLSLKFNPCNLNTMIDNLKIQFSIQPLQKNLPICAVKPAGNTNFNILTDETRLMQILSNLLENAKKHTQTGHIEFGYTVQGKNLQFFVKDTGVGIDAAHQKLIFERFRQVESQVSKISSGTGIGLSIVKGLVELFGGEIWVESEVGKGSAFYFTIPYTPFVKKEVETVVPGINNLESYAGSTILIVDDDPSNLIYLEELFSIYEFTIITATDGFEAITQFEKHPSLDLIFMDIRMPVMNGPESQQRIKAINPDIPIIALTAFAMAEDRKKMMDAGFDEYLEKPVFTETLLEMVIQFIKK